MIGICSLDIFLYVKSVSEFLMVRDTVLLLWSSCFPVSISVSLLQTTNTTTCEAALTHSRREVCVCGVWSVTWLPALSSLWLVLPRIPWAIVGEDPQAAAPVLT